MLLSHKLANFHQQQQQLSTAQRSAMATAPKCMLRFSAFFLLRCLAATRCCCPPPTDARVLKIFMLSTVDWRGSSRRPAQATGYACHCLTALAAALLLPAPVPATAPLPAPAPAPATATAAAAVCFAAR